MRIEEGVDVAESIKTRLARWEFNRFPAYRGTGGRVEYIAGDWHEVRVSVPLSRRTRNYVGTIFGGSMYGAVDPIYMVMLLRLLGDDYQVWDKEASIRFLLPGRSTLFATFCIDDKELDAIRTDVAKLGRSERCYRVELTDETGEVHAVCEKMLSIRPRTAKARVGEAVRRQQRTAAAAAWHGATADGNCGGHG